MKKTNQAYHDNSHGMSLEAIDELRFRTRSTTNQITKIIRQLDRFFDDFSCCSPRDKSEILTAISEALANAIIHGNKKDPDKFVELVIKNHGDLLEITVQDQGKGFDWKKLADPTEPENLRRKSGRGIYLMKIFMDDVKLSKTKKGMKVIMKKKLSAL